MRPDGIPHLTLGYGAGSRHITEVAESNLPPRKNGEGTQLTWE